MLLARLHGAITVWMEVACRKPGCTTEHVRDCEGPTAAHPCETCWVHEPAHAIVHNDRKLTGYQLTKHKPGASKQQSAGNKRVRLIADKVASWTHRRGHRLLPVACCRPQPRLQQLRLNTVGRVGVQAGQCGSRTLQRVWARVGRVGSRRQSTGQWSCFSNSGGQLIRHKRRRDLLYLAVGKQVLKAANIP